MLENTKKNHRTFYLQRPKYPKTSKVYESEGWKAQHKQDIDAAFNSKDE